MASTEITTEDMTLVAYLKVNGYEPDRLERAGQGCQWVFIRDDRVAELIGEYAVGDAYVEPRELALKLGLVRRKMYDFLGRPRQRVSRS